MWELARKTGLDPNSPYSYLMMAKFFSETCILVEEEDRIVGFVMAFHPPQDPESIFVWQIGVDQSQQGKGLGGQLLRELVKRERERNVWYLTATVTPSNRASQQLFRGLARHLGTTCQESECLPAHLFPHGSNHESEMLFRIGPFR